MRQLLGLERALRLERRRGLRAYEGRCSFGTIIQRYHLTIVRGLGLVIQDDHELLAMASRLYDGLYPWVRLTLP